MPFWIPLDQCMCETHENFIFKLTTLKICYRDNFWSKYLRDDVFSSDCWAGQRNHYFSGKK